MHSGGWARQLGFSISRTLADHPKSGISAHIHIVIVQRGQDILIENNDENIYPSDGSIHEFRMPQVAHGYKEFQMLAASTGQDAAGAVC